MTVLAAAVGKGETWLASDSQLTYGSQKMPLGRSKWITSNGWAVGWCGFYAGYWALIRAGISLFQGFDPDLEDDQTATAIADNVARIVRELDFKQPRDAGPRTYGMEFLIATAGALWHLDGDLSMLRVADMHAAGSGGELALGYMHGYVAANKRPVLRSLVAGACRVACAFDITCGGEIHVHHLT